jgi:hypothetical protein
MGGGREVKMPFWKDLTAARQILSDSGTLAVNKIAAEQDIARIHNDAQVWSVNHLAKVISGDDPMQAIVDLVADYWARTDVGLIISALKGIFAAASMAGIRLAGEETFESYAEGEIGEGALTGGTGWDGGAALPQPDAHLIGTEDFESYGLGAANGSAMTGGSGWNGDTAIYGY